MKLENRVVIVTGAASGIGRALCRRFAAEGTAGIICADLDAAGAESTAREVGGLARTTDVTDEAQVRALVAAATDRYGRVDVFCSNAGVISREGENAPDAEWRRSWDVHLMAHVYAARAVLPQMLARGEGYLLNTASAAGLVTHVGSAPYAVTKHAAVAFAEWLAIAHGARGIRVSVLCPQGVRTPMLQADAGGTESFLLAGSLAPEEVADCVVAGIEAESFLILPHPEVLEFVRRKATDYDRWIRGMRRFRDEVIGRRRA
jgi:NAD(P)-dependent dehydrogenase (short-subunit alcohol dehydrogenase family)